jgi:hypothetical protein
MYESCGRSKEYKRQGVPFSEGMASYELKEINIEAKAQKMNQYTSAAINLLCKRVFGGAAPGHILAMDGDKEFGYRFLIPGAGAREGRGAGEWGSLWGLGCRFAVRAGLCGTES